MRKSKSTKILVQSRGKRFLLLITLFLTGFTSLAYELIWTRKLSLVFGANALAVSTVLSIFLAGLAWGSFYGGKLIEKSKNPYKFLGIVEILIGAGCLLTLILIDGIKFAYLSLFTYFGGNLILVNLVHFLISAVILIVPTFLIGVVFPVAVKLYYQESNDIGDSVSWVYMADTVGGAIGLLATGLVLIWKMGFWNTSLWSSIVNITLGISILALLRANLLAPQQQSPQKSRKKKKGNRKENRQEINEPRKTSGKLVLALFFFSGFAALILENVWIRYFEMIYGNNMISFSLVVASFLIGLGLGSFAAKYLTRSVKNKIFLFSMIEMGIGLSSLLLMLMFPYIENIYLSIFFDVDNYNEFLILLGLLVFFMLLIPTLLMGMTLPVISEIYTNGKTIGSDIGRLYSFNSFGSILGSFLSGFVFFYLFGLQNTAIMAALIYILIAFIFIFFYEKSRLKTFLTVFVNLLFLILVLYEFYYQPEYLYIGAYYHGTQFDNPSDFYRTKEEYEVLFEKQSPYSFVSVVSARGNTLLKINGRTEGSTYNIVQNMLANLPLLFHPSPDEVASIGHGGGYTLNTITKYSAVKTIDNIEIDQVIIEADQYIQDNGRPLSDPRVNLIVADARNYLYTNPKKYDVIISEPSHIWASSPLFTKEFFEIIDNSLAEGGIYTIWLPAYEMKGYDFGVIIETIKSVFPNIKAFDYRGVMIILASHHQIDIAEDLNLTHLEDSEVIKELGIVKELDGEENMDLPAFIKKHHFSEIEEFVQDQIGEVNQLNTDDLPILEYSTLKNLYRKFNIEGTP